MEVYPVILPSREQRKTKQIMSKLTVDARVVCVASLSCRSIQSKCRSKSLNEFS